MGFLARREVGYSDHLRANKLFRFIQSGNLSAAFFKAKRPKVDPEFVGGLFCFRKSLCSGDRAYTYLYLLKVIPATRVIAHNTSSL
jgi:hypothetical protein